MEYSKEALDIIVDALEMWSLVQQCGDEYSSVSAVDGFVFESALHIPSLWEIEDLVMEICADYCIRSVWYAGVPMTSVEFVDCLQSILDMERIQYLDKKFQMMNSAQTILIDDVM